MDEVLTFEVKMGASVESCFACFLLAVSAGVVSDRVVCRLLLVETEEQPLSKCSLIMCAGTVLLHTGLQICSYWISTHQQFKTCLPCNMTAVHMRQNASQGWTLNSPEYRHVIVCKAPINIRYTLRDG